jgi:DNA modification methylase
VPACEILTGDCRDLLPLLPDNSIACCITSPPYLGLRDYGCDGQLGLEPTPDEYVANLVDVFRQVRRALRPDGTLWLNLGDSYARDAKKGQHKPGDSGKEAYLYDRGGGRASACTDLAAAGLKPKDLIGIPWHTAFALRQAGWWLRAEIIWTKPNAKPENVRDRPTRAHEQIFLFSKSETYHYDADAVREPAVSVGRSSGNVARKVARAGERSRLDTHAGSSVPWADDGTGRNRRSVWSIPVRRACAAAHFAQFPPELVEPCLLAGCPPGGITLDPFAGSGTVGEVALRHGRRALLLELNPEYAALAAERVSHV